MGFKSSYKKAKHDPNTEYVNAGSGETLNSEQGSITSYNVVDNNYCIVDSKEYVIIDKDALQYIKSILDARAMYYVYQLIDLCDGDKNALYDSNNNLHTRETLIKELDIARTTFSKLMITLHKESVIAYHDVYMTRDKRVRYILLNPTLARRTKRITNECRKLFRDLTVQQ